VYELYIDMRCYGKGYEEFYRRLMDEGVHMVRGRAAEVTNVALSPEEEGRPHRQDRGHAAGHRAAHPGGHGHPLQRLAPAKDAKEVSQTFRLRLLGQRVLPRAASQARAVSTVTDGIFIAGCCQYPKDIPDTVAQAGAAAACALALGGQSDREGRTDDLVHRS